MTIPPRIIAGLLAVLALLVFAAYQAREAQQARTELLTFKARATQQALDLTNQHARETARRLFVQSEVIHAQVQQTEQLRAAAGRAADADRSLRGELARLAARSRAAAADPSATGASQAAAEAGAVLADLLGQCSSRRQELAEYADSARIAGEACQRSYEALTP